MNAVLQHPPECIPSMLAAAEAGADLVVASRYLPGGSAGGLHGLVRRLVSSGARLLSRLLFSEAAITAAIGVAYGLATATVVAGNAGAADRTGAARLNGHSHREQRNVKAAYGVNGPANQQRGHVRYATSAGWIAEPASGTV